MDTNLMIPKGASEALVTALTEVAENLKTVENLRIPRLELTSEGFVLDEETVTPEITGTILHIQPRNVYYAKSFNPKADAESPDCYSLDAKTPEEDSKFKQHPTCKGCPKAEFGSNSMGSGKACRNLRLLYTLVGDEAIIPKVIQVNPTSLQSLDKYLFNVTDKILHINKVKTKMTAYKDSPQDTYSKVKFSFAGKLDPVRVTDVSAIKSYFMPFINNEEIAEAINENQDSEEAPF